MAGPLVPLIVAAPVSPYAGDGVPRRRFGTPRGRIHAILPRSLRRTNVMVANPVADLEVIGGGSPRV
jgi:hypothetical protein